MSTKIQDLITCYIQTAETIKSRIYNRKVITILDEISKTLWMMHALDLPIEFLQSYLSQCFPQIEKADVLQNIFDQAELDLENGLLSKIPKYLHHFEEAFPLLKRLQKEAQATIHKFMKFLSAIPQNNYSLPAMDAFDNLNLEEEEWDINQWINFNDPIHLRDDPAAENNTLHRAILLCDMSKIDDLINQSLENGTLEFLLIEKSFNNTPLILAIKTGHFKAAITILTYMSLYGIDVNSQSDYGMTALHWACFYRQSDLVAQLFEAGADPSLLTVNKNSPHFFAEFNPPNLTETLMGAETIVQGKVSLKECPDLTDLLFHCDKIALNQKWIKTVQEYNRLNYKFGTSSGPRFHGFFNTFKSRLLAFRETVDDSEKTPDAQVIP